MFLLFTTAFDFIGLGTTAQAIGQVTFTLSWVVLIVRGRLVTIGGDVEEAAANLGAPPLHVVGRVLLPLLVPAMAASLLVSFALSIDDFVVSQYLASGADTTTVPMRNYSQARGGPTPALNALATIMLVVSLLALVLAYVVFRRLTRGEERGSTLQQLATMETGDARRGRRTSPTTTSRSSTGRAIPCPCTCRRGHLRVLAADDAVPSAATAEAPEEVPAG
jgi:spermidine/putrescine transport system permease protein